MIFESVLDFSIDGNPITIIDYYSDKNELYLYTSIQENPLFPEKNTLLLKLTGCHSFRLEPDPEDLHEDFEKFFHGLYRSIAKGTQVSDMQIDIPNLPIAPRGLRCYFFTTDKGFAYIAYAKNHELLMTWPLK